MKKILRNDRYRYSYVPSWYKTIIEVVLRKNFGRNYFFFKFFLRIWIRFTLIPLGFILFFVVLTNFNKASIFDFSDTSIWYYIFHLGFFSWFIYSIVLLYYAIKRDSEILSSAYIDMDNTSYNRGEFNRWIIKYVGEDWTWRAMESQYEPLIFAVLGVILILFGEFLGVVFIVASIKYHLEYKRMYKLGDNDIQARIDRKNTEAWQNNIEESIMDHHNENVTAAKAKRANVEQNDEDYWDTSNA